MFKLTMLNLKRLKKSKIFWLSLIGIFLYGAGTVVFSYARGQQEGYQVAILNDSIFLHLNVIGFILAAFCSLFLSTEYREGAIRNKLIIGKTRPEVYLSNLVSNCFVAILLNMAYIVAVCLFGIPLVGFLVSIETAVFIKMIIASTLAILAYTSIFTMIGMLVQNSSVVTILTVVIALIMLSVSPLIKEGLLEPEYQITLGNVNGTDEMVITSKEPNPYYVDGIKRGIYTFMDDVLPSGQIVQILKETEVGTEGEISHYITYGIIDVQPPNYIKLALYSCLLIFITTIIGMFIFIKKDLK
ncbi:MAG: ABC transporter permease subunit [Cellulosilyticaceae bacterium]